MFEHTVMGLLKRDALAGLLYGLQGVRLDRFRLGRVRQLGRSRKLGTRSWTLRVLSSRTLRGVSSPRCMARFA